jgi:hypothetical protein
MDALSFMKKFNLHQYLANDMTNDIFFFIHNMKKVIIQMGGEHMIMQVLGSPSTLFSIFNYPTYNWLWEGLTNSTLFNAMSYYLENTESGYHAQINYYSFWYVYKYFQTLKITDNYLTVSELHNFFMGSPICAYFEIDPINLS